MRTIRTTATTTSRLLGPAFVALSLVVFGVLALGPRTGRYQTATVLTASMRPTMPEGSMVVTTPVDPAALRVGDVITYRIPVEDRRIVTHRIVEIHQPGPTPVVRTKGDANNGVDPWMARLTGGTVWKARVSVPKVGYATVWLRDPRLRPLLVLFVPFVLAALWLKDIWAKDDAMSVPQATPLSMATPMVTATPVAPGLRPTVAMVALLSLGAFAVRQRA